LSRKVWVSPKTYSAIKNWADSKNITIDKAVNLLLSQWLKEFPTFFKEAKKA